MKSKMNLIYTDANSKKVERTKICGNAELFLIKEMTAVYLLEKLRVAGE
jgi:hypothetical protein